MWLRVGVLAVGGRVISPIEGVKVLVRVQGWLGRGAGRMIDIPGHITLVCPQLWPCEISLKGSRVEVGEDVM